VKQNREKKALENV